MIYKMQELLQIFTLVRFALRRNDKIKKGLKTPFVVALPGLEPGFKV